MTTLMTLTLQEYDVQPDGTVPGIRWSAPSTTVLDDAAADQHMTRIRRRNRNRNLAVNGGTLEFDTYAAGYWDAQLRNDPEGVAELQAMRTRVSFQRKSRLDIAVSLD